MHSSWIASSSSSIIALLFWSHRLSMSAIRKLAFQHVFQRHENLAIAGESNSSEIGEFVDSCLNWPPLPLSEIFRVIIGKKREKPNESRYSNASIEVHTEYLAIYLDLYRVVVLTCSHTRGGHPRELFGTRARMRIAGRQGLLFLERKRVHGSFGRVFLYFYFLYFCVGVCKALAANSSSPRGLPASLLVSRTFSSSPLSTPRAVSYYTTLHPPCLLLSKILWLLSKSLTRAGKIKEFNRVYGDCAKTTNPQPYARSRQSISTVKCDILYAL